MTLRVEKAALAGTHSSSSSSIPISLGINRLVRLSAAVFMYPKSGLPLSSLDFSISAIKFQNSMPNMLAYCMSDLIAS